MMRRLVRCFQELASDHGFLRGIGKLETVVSKALSLGMVVVVLVSVFDLYVYLIDDLFSNQIGAFSTTLVQIFGLFLNILVALEVLENITAYLREHVVQVELVIATSLTAVARKIIIFDFNKNTSAELLALSVGIFALSISYLIVRNSTSKSNLK